MSSSKKARTREIDVICSSSGARAPCFIGSLKGILEKGYEIKRIAGTSGGALIASGYALGMSIEEMTDLALKAPYKKFKDFSYKNLLSLTNPSIYSGEELDDFYKRVFGEKTLKDFIIDCKISVIKILDGERTSIDKQTYPDLPVWQAVRMSSTIPFIFPYLKLEGAPITDGGLDVRTFNIFPEQERPIVSLRPRADSHKLANVLANSNKKILFLWNYIKIVIDYFMNSVDNQHVPQDEWERTIMIPTHSLSFFNFEMNKKDILDLIRYGYEAVMSSNILPDVSQ